MFLTIGPEYDWDALTTWQVRAMADEVAAEWVVEPAENGGESPKLELHCRAQGGWILFRTKTRVRMFRGYMPLVLAVMRYGDRALVEAHPELDDAQVEVVWHFRGKRKDEHEAWGRFGEYRG